MSELTYMKISDVVGLGGESPSHEADKTVCCDCPLLFGDAAMIERRKEDASDRDRGCSA